MKITKICAGQAVIIPIPSFDRSPFDEKNSLGRIIEVNDDKYLVGTSKGTLKVPLVKNAFEPTSAPITDPIPQATQMLC